MGVFMFKYNKFWHFWSNLDNRYYARAFGLTLLAAVVGSFVFFPAMWATPLVAIIAVSLPSLLVNGCMWAFTKVSDFFYERQNEHLKQLEQSSEDEVLKEQLNLFINRRAVCPDVLLAGRKMDVSEPTCVTQATKGPLMQDKDAELNMVKREGELNRNPSFVEENQKLFMKQAASMDVLSEVAAQDMADLVGLSHVIPKSTLAKNPTQLTDVKHSKDLISSREAMSKLIANDERTLKNTPKVQDLVGKFVFNLKVASYRTQAQAGKLSKLLFIQSLIPNAKDGLQWFQELFNEPLPGQPVMLFGPSRGVREAQRAQAKALLNRIDQQSFEDTFVLQIILGSQDSNPGNTLFVTDSQGQKTTLHSIDHERIMPEDNYNMTKMMPMGRDLASIKERPVKNVFPMRIWLAGLPQADVPFSKVTMMRLLKILNPERLIEYHRNKKLFTAAAVGAQLERVQVIRRAFEEACKQDNVTLTPKALFGMFVNNHPSYGFLKNEQQLSDLSTYMLLGAVPEGADMSLFRHPLQYFQMMGIVFEAGLNQAQGKKALSDESFATSFAPYVTFFSQAVMQKAMVEPVNKPGLDILKETSEALRATV
jgi:hypothetical protein